MNQRKIVWAPAALVDLKDIFDYISSDNSAAAKTFLKRIVEQIEKLACFPKMGSVIPEIGELRYRQLVVGGYRIFHEIRRKEVFIFRVFHSKRLFKT